MNELILSTASQNQASLINLNQADIPSVSGKNRAELKKAAEEFEAVFIGQLLKVMRETIQESGLEGSGFGKGIYTELFDQEVALSMAGRGALGISDMIYRNIVEEEAFRDSGQVDGTWQDWNGSRPAADVSGGLRLSGDQEAAPGISGMVLPVNAPVSSGFGMRADPFTGNQRFHRGIDIAAPAGTPVVAALPGRVISVGNEQGGYGKTVLVEHDGGLRTRYGHLDSINVKVGDTVTSEKILGRVGSTGRSTGPHLHFEVIRNGVHVDPVRLTAVTE